MSSGYIWPESPLATPRSKRRRPVGTNGTRTHLPDPRLVAVESDDRAVGWAAGSAVSERCVYGGVIEHSVYVDPSWRARGIGRLLLEASVGESERLGYWTIQSGIFPENEASLALHEQCGFRIVGRREKVGLHMGVWRDVILSERRKFRGRN